METSLTINLSLRKQTLNAHFKKQNESIFLFPTHLLHAVCDCFIVCLSITLLRRAKTALIRVQKMGFITNSTSLFWQKERIYFSQNYCEIRSVTAFQPPLRNQKEGQKQEAGEAWKKTNL